MLSLASLCLLSIVPGLLWGLVVFPKASDLEPSQRLAFALPVGLFSTVCVGLVLVQLRMLGGGPAWIGNGCSCLMGMMLAAARKAEVLDIGRAVWRRCRGGTWFWALGAVGVTVAGHIHRQNYGDRNVGVVSWYYLGDILQMLSERRVPEIAIDYGIPMDFEVNKISWNLVMAEWIAMAKLESDPFQVMHTTELAVVAAGAFGAWMFARSLVQRAWVASAGAIILMWTPRIVRKFSAFRGESYGIMLFFILLWMIHEGVRRRDWRWHLLVGMTVALTATSHMVPAVVAVMWYGALVIGRTLGDWREGIRALPRIAGSAGLALLLLVGIWGMVGKSLLGGQEGLQREYQSYRGYDPTHAFLHLAVRGPLNSRVRNFRPAEPKQFYTGPKYVLKQLGGETGKLAVPFWPKGGDELALPVALVLLALTWRRHRKSRELGLAIPCFFLILFLWGLYFSYAYHTYLPALHPGRREFPYFQVFLGVWVAVLLDLLVDWLEARRRVFSTAEMPESVGQPRGPKVVWPAVRRAGRQIRDLGARWAPTGIGVLLAVGILHSVVERGVVELEDELEYVGKVSDDGHRALRWLRENTPEDAQILVDGSSDGVVQVLARRQSLTEGRAPYFQPANLPGTLQKLEGAYAFYQRPRRHSDWLFEEGVDYVVLGSREIGTRVFNSRRRVGGRLSFLKLAARFGHIRIYEVLKRERSGGGDHEEAETSG